MRDPKRIRPFLEKLAEKWEEYPDQRFGQLIINIIAPGPLGDTWDHEEDEWEMAIQSFALTPCRGER